MEYTVSRVKNFDSLEPGLTMHEVVNSKNLVIGYVFIHSGKRDYRGPDGLPLIRKERVLRKNLDLAVSGCIEPANPV